ncbi:MAG: nucleotidyltransferase family protein [Anaerolineae bacterium]|nr:nucleotidyltransferase family protein [Anaerolineae bacterium]
MLSIAISQADLAAFCKRHHIHKLAVFGSVLREDFRSDSDIDVLAEFEPNQLVSLFDLGAAQQELSELLGREADLKTSGFLSPYFRQQVLDTAQVIYESQ